MFDWLFKPSCPCDPLAKAWVEERLAWLDAEFNDSAFTGRRIVLPNAQWFPERYEPNEGWLKTTLDRVCDYMDVDAELVEYELFDESGKPQMVNSMGQSMGGTAGTFQFINGRFLIRVEQQQLGDPMSLVGTLAHEIALAKLLGDGIIDPEVYDHELVTDLTVVHMGLGIFMANQPTAMVSRMTNWPDSELKKPEYMSAPMFGWALAHLAWFRGEAKPVWSKYLEWGAQANFKQGLRYLFHREDSKYLPVKLRKQG